jgi:hypothetical protein
MSTVARTRTPSTRISAFWDEPDEPTIVVTTPPAVAPRDYDATPPGVPTLPLADWFECQVGWHDSQSSGDDLHGLLRDELRPLASYFRFEHLGLATVGGYLRTHQPYRSPHFDLAAVAVPIRATNTDLTDDLDAEAARYLAMGSDAARCIAHTILEIADDCEHGACDTLADYYDSMAAMEEAWATAREDLHEKAGAGEEVWAW